MYAAYLICLLCRITYMQPCLVFMDDSPFSINAMLLAFLSPEAIEALLGLQSFLFPFLFFLGSQSEITCGFHQAISGRNLGD